MVCSAHRRLARWTASPWSMARRGWRSARPAPPPYCSSWVVSAALRVVIVYNTSAGTALVISKVTPFLFFGFLSAWTVAYGAHHKKKGERMAAATSEVTEASPAPDAK